MRSVRLLCGLAVILVFGVASTANAATVYSVVPYVDLSAGSADMLEVAHMAVHAVPMTSREAMRYCFEAVTTNPAKIMGLEGYGLEVGCNGDLVVLQARDPIEAIRLKATRLAVIRRGKVISETPAKIAKLALDHRPDSVDPAAYAPPG